MSSLIHALRENARLYPDRPAVFQGSEVIDHAAMGDRSDRVAAGLAARGVVKGIGLRFIVPIRRNSPSPIPHRGAGAGRLSICC